MAPPNPAKPISIMAQVKGSGTPLTFRPSAAALLAASAT
jgi:hypothetical protein